ncbi:MAG: chloride channel protein [Pseudomonadota bacterium]|nr:chloride channel protein [Pseudomonadota bacterium]
MTRPWKLVILIICVGLFIGTAVALATKVFVNSILFLTDLREGASIFEAGIMGVKLNFAPVITLLIAALIINFIKKYTKITRFHGPADSIYGAHRTDNEIDTKTGYFSTFAALISAGGGASVGQYGPLVHFGATLGTSIRLLTRNALSTDIFIGCGTAAAISAGFNAPIAGLIFAHEALLRHFSIKAITPIAISSFTAAAVSERVFGGSQVLVTNVKEIDLIGFLPMAIISGLFFGFVALIYMQSLSKAPQILAKTKIPPSYLIFVGALICGSIGMFYPEVLGIGTSTINSMLNIEISVQQVLIFLILKLVLTTVCLSTGFFGGVFSPALFVGAAAGITFAGLIATTGLESNYSVLALCGMASVGASVIGTPIAGVLLVIELSNSYDLGVISIVSIASATLITYLFFGQSLFDRQLLNRGIDIALGRSHLKLMDQSIGSLSSDDFIAFLPNTPPKQAIKLMITNEVTEAYLVDEKGIYRGKIRLVDLLSNTAQKQCYELRENNEILLLDQDSVLQGIETCKNFVGESIPVINKDKNTITGIITESDLFTAYLDLNRQIRDLEAGLRS